MTNLFCSSIPQTERQALPLPNLARIDRFLLSNSRLYKSFIARTNAPKPLAELANPLAVAILLDVIILYLFLSLK